MFRVIIAGGRTFDDYKLLEENCDVFLKNKKKDGIVIVSGAAQGADTLGEKYAQSRGYQVHRMPANWNKYGKSAGYIRNAEMAQNADALIAFWDGESKGTDHMIRIAEERKMPYRVVRYSKKGTR